MSLRKIKRKRLVFVVCSFILIFIILIFLYFFVRHNKVVDSYYKVESRIQDSKTVKIEDAETVGWLKVQGTNIDYPVIKETNDAYYSGKDYLWQPNIYVEGENREVVYGHNILNVSSSPLVNDKNHVRFEPLMGFVYEDFSKENLYIQHTKNGVDYLYKIYAVSFLYMLEDVGESINNKEELDEYIFDTKRNSLYDYDVDVDSSDTILSLITCTRYFGLDGRTQFKVDARLVRKNENIEKYNVESNKNYDIIK